MNILLFTNTYLPHVGGVARSVHTLEQACRRLGHEVRVIAPEFEDAEPSENVLRVPAIQNFNGSDFSVRIPVPRVIGEFIEDFAPDVVHSHHPFLLGDAALRVARRLHRPIVFTHHTLYERYTHYVPFDSPAMKRIAIQLATEYCNMCDSVIAPSRSVADLLDERGVEVPVRAIPTGIDVEAFASGDGPRLRKKLGIPENATVIGLVGRVAREKNLPFIAEAAARYLKRHPDAAFLLVGDGKALEETLGILRRQGVREAQIHAPGRMTGTDLIDAYAALDCFVFASQTETQGLVLAEAMAAGTPVVALDGPGVREIMDDGKNGLMLPSGADPEAFASAVERLTDDAEFAAECSRHASETARDYTVEACTTQVLDCYEAVIAEKKERAKTENEFGVWDRFMESIENEWDLLAAKFAALGATAGRSRATEAKLD